MLQRAVVALVLRAAGESLRAGEPSAAQRVSESRRQRRPDAFLARERGPVRRKLGSAKGFSGSGNIRAQRQRVYEERQRGTAHGTRYASPPSGSAAARALRAHRL